MSEDLCLNFSKVPLVRGRPRPPMYTENSCGDVEIKLLKDNSLSKRLSMRKVFVKRKRLLIDVEFFLCMVGIILVVIETALYDHDPNHKTSESSLIIKSFVSASTLLLLCALCCKYYSTIQIRILDQKLASWDLAIDYAIVGRFITEIIVCAIHPFPGNIFFTTYQIHGGDIQEIHIDAILSVAMMFRLYLLAKFAVIHITSLTNNSLLSTSAASQVRINTRFVFKIVLTTSPAIVITCVMIFMLLSLSWSMRTCEIYFGHSDASNGFLDAMWLVTVTFLTVGYGDIRPESYCGRFISVCSGIVGISTTALLVAVVAKKLEQSRSQKYVFNFMSRMSTERQRKAAASDIVKAVFKTFLLKNKSGKIDEKAIRRQRDKLNQAVRRMKQSQQELERIAVSSVGIIEVSQQIDRIMGTVDKVDSNHKQLSVKMTDVDNRLTAIEDAVLEIKELLRSKR